MFVQLISALKSGLGEVGDWLVIKPFFGHNITTFPELKIGLVVSQIPLISKP